MSDKLFHHRAAILMGSRRARQDKALYPVPRGGGRGRGRGVRGRGGGGYEERRGGRGEWEEDEYYHRERGRMSPRGYDDRYRGKMVNMEIVYKLTSLRRPFATAER